MVSYHDLLNTHFFCGFKIQYLSRIWIDPILNLLNLLASKFPYITSFRDESPNHPIDILITPSFPVSGHLKCTTPGRFKMHHLEA